MATIKEKVLGVLDNALSPRPKAWRFFKADAANAAIEQLEAKLGIATQGRQPIFNIKRANERFNELEAACEAKGISLSAGAVILKPAAVSTAGAGTGFQSLPSPPPVAAPAPASISATKPPMKSNILAQLDRITDGKARVEFYRKNKAAIDAAHASAPAPARPVVEQRPAASNEHPVTLTELEGLVTAMFGGHAYPSGGGGFTGDTSGLTQQQINFEILRDRCFRSHIKIPGLSYNQSVARGVRRQDYSQLSEGERKDIAHGESFAKTFLDVMRGQSDGSGQGENSYGAGAARRALAKAAHQQKIDARRAAELRARHAAKLQEAKSIEDILADMDRRTTLKIIPD